MGLENFHGSPRDKHEHVITENEDGSFEAHNLGKSLNNEVENIRKENREIDATLQIIENPAMPKGIKDRMKNYLEEIKPDFNWGLYLELSTEESSSTLH